MKRVLQIMVLVALALVVAACKTQTSTQSSGQTGNPATLQPGGGTLGGMAEMAVGTLKLEGGAQAITAEEAGKLLPLWKAYRTLSQDSSASRLELTALATQVRETMTTEQVAAIDGMKLGMSDLMTLMQSRGIQMQAAGPSGAASGTASSNSASRSSSSGAGGGGGPAGGPGGGPGGGAPPDMGGAGGGVPPDMGGMPGASGTPGATTGQRSAANILPVPLLDNLIQLLQTRAQG
jgi:hypothetical protein